MASGRHVLNSILQQNPFQLSYDTTSLRIAECNAIFTIDIDAALNAADNTHKLPQSKRVGLQCNAAETARTESWCYSVFQIACGNINAIKNVKLFENKHGSYVGYCLEIIYQKDCGAFLLSAISSLKESIDARASIFDQCNIVNDNSWQIEINKSCQQQSAERDRIVNSMYHILQSKKDKSNKKINMKTMHTSIKLGSCTSEYQEICNGIPQGGCVSPQLFNFALKCCLMPILSQLDEDVDG